MKVIDVLQKIANGEEIDFKIECSGEKYSLSKGFTLLDENNEEVKWYIDEEWLNIEVEIIEEPKKIEYINEDDFRKRNILEMCSILKNKISEIIDYINDKENK